MSTLSVKSIVNGAMGSCYAIIDGDIEEMFYVKNIEITAEKEKSDIKVLGQTGAKHKANGWNGTGSMTMYYTTSKFRKMMLNYIKTGVDTTFDIQVTNDDPSSNIGKQTAVIRGVNLDSLVMAKLDINSTELEEDVDFTYDDIDLLDEFGEVIVD